VLAWLFILIVVVGGLFWLGMRWSRRPPQADDLRRADDAESERMPTAEELQDRIGEAFGETRPPDGFNPLRRITDLHWHQEEMLGSIYVSPWPRSDAHGRGMD